MVWDLHFTMRHVRKKNYRKKQPNFHQIQAVNLDFRFFASNYFLCGRPHPNSAKEKSHIFALFFYKAHSNGQAGKNLLRRGGDCYI
jgi:hypothetical protein